MAQQLLLIAAARYLMRCHPRLHLFSPQQSWNFCWQIVKTATNNTREAKCKSPLWNHNYFRRTGLNNAADKTHIYQLFFNIIILCNTWLQLRNMLDLGISSVCRHQVKDGINAFNFIESGGCRAEDWLAEIWNSSLQSPFTRTSRKCDRV